MRTSGEFNSYKNMRERCAPVRVPSREVWPNYGGREIRVCERWLLPNGEGFANFLADMGPRPAGKTLDRIDVQGHYEPLNCRWADADTQAQNRRPILFPGGNEPPVQDVRAMEQRLEEFAYEMF